MVAPVGNCTPAERNKYLCTWCRQLCPLPTATTENHTMYSNVSGKGSEMTTFLCAAQKSGEWLPSMIFHIPCICFLYSVVT